MADNDGLAIFPAGGQKCPPSLGSPARAPGAHLNRQGRARRRVCSLARVALIGWGAWRQGLTGIRVKGHLGPVGTVDCTSGECPADVDVRALPIDQVTVTIKM